MRRIAGIFALVYLWAAPAFGQGSQRQSVSVSPQGTPIPGADVWACQEGSTPNYSAAPPCTLANIYSNPSLGTGYTITQPLVSDGLGNYTYYAAAGTYVEVITGSSTTGYSSTIVLPCAPNSTASGCAGGAGNPAGSDTQVQINNHSQFGAVTGLAVDSSTSPSILTVPLSESVKGPRPRVDATAYGADPTGAADSTTAITNAAAAACNAGSTLYIPPGTYSLSQPQLPSTSPVISIPCAHIHITALGDQGTAQSEQAPQAKLIVANLGSSPNATPVFGFKYPTNSGGITIENLQVSGYNQALSFYATPIVALNNVCATAQSTSLTDNVPLKVTNVSWFRMTNGCLNSGSSSLPMALFTGEAPLGSESPLVAFVQMEHVRGSGANFQYVQRVNTSGSGPGNFVFNDVTPVGSATDFLTVTNTSGHMGQTALPVFGPVFFLNTSLPGAIGSGALINFNSSGSNLSGVHIQNSSGSTQSVPLTAVRMTAGSLQDCEVHGTVGAIVEDSSGNPFGSCSLETQGGLDFIADSTIASSSRLRSEATTGANPTPNLRFYLSPDSRASYGIDAGQGLLFNDGGSNGFNASLTETTKGAIDVQFANLFAPTNVSGSATTGGTLPAGTYYPFVATTSNNCATLSAPSIAGTPVTVGGSNDAVSVSWTAPLQGVAAINGYCVAIASSASNANAGLSYAGLFVSGATTTSATITAVLGSMQFPMANAMTSVHRFTPTGLHVTGGLNFYADTGTANAYVVTTSPAITSIPVGAVFNFQAVHANTGTSTLNVDGIGVVTIKKNGGTGGSVGANLASGDIATGQLVTVMYDGTNFQMQSTLGNASGGVGGGANTALSNLAGVAINASLLPAGAGADSLGSGTLPFGDLFLGDAANAANDFNTTALTANRTTTVPDANTVLPQPLSAQARTVVTGLGSTNGAFTTSAFGQCTNVETGTSYAVAGTDFGCSVAGSNASAETYTIAQAGTGSFTNNFYFVLWNQGIAGQGNITLTATTSTLSCPQLCTGSTLTLPPGFRAYIWSPDNANYAALVTPAPISLDYNGRTTAITTTTLFTAPTNGTYTMSYVVNCDTSVSTATATPSYAWTDPSGTTHSITGSAATCTTLGSASIASLMLPIDVEASTAVTYSVGVANSPNYDFHIKVEGPW
jgi:Pectate lyase superfamily protein